MFTMKRFTTLLLGCLALLLVICMIVFPDRAFQASLQGLSIWWKLIFPALLPFLIITEILRGMGFLHALGTLMEPLLRYLFRLPGAGGWVLALGFTVGAPSGSIAVSELRRGQHITRDEAERLLSISHVTSPVVLITVVGVAFLNNAQFGLALALLHYSAAIIMGLLQRFPRKSLSEAEVEAPEVTANRGANVRAIDTSAGLTRRSLTVLRAAQTADGRTFGKLLGDSVTHSIQQLMAIGGVMMIFSVLTQVIAISSITTYAASALSALGLATPANVEALLSALLPGLFEVHLGAYTMSQSSMLSGAWQYAILSALFAWGGLSAHAQVKSFTLATDIRYLVFLRSRLLHAAISFVLTGVLWNPLNQWLSGVASPVFLIQSAKSGLLNARLTSSNIQDINLWPLLSPMMMWFGAILLIMLFLSVFTAFIWRHHERRAPSNKR
jgi:sporulation integral membrane protein YlbJ